MIPFMIVCITRKETEKETVYTAHEKQAHLSDKKGNTDHASPCLMFKPRLILSSLFVIDPLKIFNSPLI